MKRLSYYIYQVYKLCVFIPLLVGTTAFFTALVIVMVSFMSTRTASRICGTSWARIVSAAIPMRVRCRGMHNIDKTQSYVITSNHESQCDILVLYGWIGVDFKWVMKMELDKVPFIGIAGRKLGHIFVDRSDRDAALASLKAAREKIVGGTSVVFFPEGTRSPTGELLPFKKGAFRMALDLGLPILPITITGTRSILPTKTLDLYPGSAGLVG